MSCCSGCHPRQIVIYPIDNRNPPQCPSGELSLFHKAKLDLDVFSLCLLVQLRFQVPEVAAFAFEILGQNNFHLLLFGVPKECWAVRTGQYVSVIHAWKNRRMIHCQRYVSVQIRLRFTLAKVAWSYSCKITSQDACLYVCLEFIVPLEDFSLIQRCHHCLPL